MYCVSFGLCLFSECTPGAWHSKTASQPNCVGLGVELPPPHADSEGDEEPALLPGSQKRWWEEGQEDILERPELHWAGLEGFRGQHGGQASRPPASEGVKRCECRCARACV